MNSQSFQNSQQLYKTKAIRPLNLSELTYTRKENTNSNVMGGAYRFSTEDENFLKMNFNFSERINIADNINSNNS
jgi:hypothetical protein